MAKAKVKTKEEVKEVGGKNLSLEKRMELYEKDFNKFKETMSEQWGLSLGLELMYTPRGMFPRLTLVDLMKKEPNPNGEQKEISEQAA